MRKVQARAFDRYGDETGLEAEHEQRANTQQAHKDRRRTERVDKLRKETLTTSWMQQRKKHEHVFKAEDEVRGAAGSSARDLHHCLHACLHRRMTRRLTSGPRLVQTANFR